MAYRGRPQPVVGEVGSRDLALVRCFSMLEDNRTPVRNTVNTPISFFYRCGHSPSCGLEMSGFLRDRWSYSYTPHTCDYQPVPGARRPEFGFQVMWLVSLARDLIKPQHTAADIVKAVRDEFKITISSDQAARIHAKYYVKNSYRFLPQLFSSVLRGEGALGALETLHVNGWPAIYHRSGVIYSTALLRPLADMEPLDEVVFSCNKAVNTDGGFFLFAAAPTGASPDGDDGLAVAHVLVESSDSWRWFARLLMTGTRGSRLLGPETRASFAYGTKPDTQAVEAAGFRAGRSDCDPDRAVVLPAWVGGVRYLFLEPAAFFWAAAERDKSHASRKLLSECIGDEAEDIMYARPHYDQRRLVPPDRRSPKEFKCTECGQPGHDRRVCPVFTDLVEGRLAHTRLIRVWRHDQDAGAPPMVLRPAGTANLRADARGRLLESEPDFSPAVPRAAPAPAPVLANPDPDDIASEDSDFPVPIPDPRGYKRQRFVPPQQMPVVVIDEDEEEDEDEDEDDLPLPPGYKKPRKN